MDRFPGGMLWLVLLLVTGIRVCWPRRRNCGRMGKKPCRKGGISMRSLQFVVTIAAICSIAAIGGAQAPAPVGLWEFQDGGNLGLATIGPDLAPTGSGFTSVPGIAGADTAVSVAVGSYYSLTHGIAPNGGGTRVNDWSILYDFRITTLVWHCFFQTNTANTDDGEYFIRNLSRELGVGDLGYSTFTATTGTWYRLLITFTIAGGNATYTAYIDGSPIATQSAPASLFVDQRFSLAPDVLLFADNDGEDGPIEVSNVAIWGQGLTASDATALGAAGDPILPVVPEPTPSIHVTPGTWVEVGDRVEFSASLPGAVSYHWYKDDGMIGGETAATFVIDPVDTIDAGEYFCRIDDGSKAPVDTAVVTIEVFPPGTLPVAGIAGLAALIGGVAIGGMRQFRKRRRR